MTNDILKEVEVFIREFFKSKLLEDNSYHNFSHTLDVARVAEEIACAEKISNEELEILLIAAWFHDTGHLICCKGHEEQSVNFAKAYLEEKGYPSEKITEVLGCIAATKIPQSPKNKLEQIICDADLHHIGLPGIENKGEILRSELECRNIRKFTDKEWYELSLDFLQKHQFFTDYAKEKYTAQKEINKSLLQEKLNAFLIHQTGH